MVKDEPRAPAAAYWAVSRELPDEYWAKAPPTIGIRVTATHRRDNVTTEWYLSDPVANAVVPKLRRTHGLRVQTAPYKLSVG